MHPISLLQKDLVAALRGDVALAAIAGDRIFDAAPIGQPPAYVAIGRHDLIVRDGDLAPVNEHRLLVQCWADQPSRKRALDMADRVMAVAASFVATAIVVTHREHMRTETAIDRETGLARAAVTLRYFTE
jgi:hypothetical protein